MDSQTYNSIVDIVNKYRGLAKDCLKVLQQQFKSINHETLTSIVFLEWQKRMKAKYFKFQSQKSKYFDDYNAAVQKGESPGIIVRIAQKYVVPPCLVAKYILQQYFEQNDESANGSESKVVTYLRDTALIPDMDLSYEVFLCTLYDDVYSPLSEAMRQSLGQQYEVKLHKEVVQLGLAFRNEEDLRKYGYDKTPDVKLEVPVAVDGFVINWIESKALFGDPDFHIDYMKNQYLCYWNRFGPGLVIYWFGYLETIADSSDKRFIIRDHLPKDIIHLSTPGVFGVNGKDDSF